MTRGFQQRCRGHLTEKRLIPAEGGEISRQQLLIKEPGASLVDSEMQEAQKIQVQSLGSEVGLETHSGILAWKIPWTEEPGMLQPMGHEELGTT